MAIQPRNLIGNGDYALGGLGNWANWNSTGTWDSTGGGTNAPTFVANDASNTLSYSGLSGLDNGPGANGAGRVVLDIGWNDAGPGTTGDTTTMEIRIGGLLIATISTPQDNGTTAAISYSNGASGNLNTLAESSFGNWTLETLEIDLPAAVPSSGALDISISGGDDDIQIDNVQVVVNEVVPDAVDAVDDNIAGVSEDEVSGDIDGNVLGNDATPTVAVTAINGQSANVGQAVVGSGGGTFTIDSAGNVDFDGQGQFDGLAVGESATSSVTYTITEQTPFDPGSQSVQTSTGVGASDQQAFFTFSAGEFTNDGSTQISGSVNLSGITQPTYNILFIMDVSGSTVFNDRIFAGAGDNNGDGTADEVIDAEIAALRQLSAEIDLLGFSDDDLQIGLIHFDNPNSSNNSTAIIEESAGDQSFDAGSAALDSAINPGANIAGGTNFGAALDLAITWFNGQPTRDNNVIYFVSDGQDFGGDFSSQVDTLTDTNGLNAQINGVGVSSFSSLTDLNQLDNTGGAVQVTDLAQLNAALQPPTLSAEIVDFRIFVDGVEDTSFDLTDLTASGTGFSINPQALSGLSLSATSTVRAEIEFDDGTVLTNVVDVEVQPASTDTATVTVTITGENDGPVAVDDTATVSEDGPALAIDVVLNDTDVDGDDLFVSGVDTTGTLGSVIIDPADND
ncbi:MAG: Ig-like domain-containing protein, partial [Pseudomonadota bacterium]